MFKKAHTHKKKKPVASKKKMLILPQTIYLGMYE